MKPYSSDFKPFPTFSYQLPEIYLHFHNKKTLMKPDTFDNNPLLFFLLHLYPLYHLIILLNCF